VRARDPDADGFVDREGVKLFYEVFGSGDPTILLVPTTPIVHSRMWKGQVAYLARHFRVVTYDGRGNGRSGRPRGPECYDDRKLTDDALAVLDATGSDRFVAAGLCSGTKVAVRLAAEHPDRVLAVVAFAPNIPFGPDLSNSCGRAFEFDFDAILDTDEGWAKCNRHYWLRDWSGWAQFWADQLFPEPHSTKQIEDMAAWMGGTTGEVQLFREDSPHPMTEQEGEALCRRVRCPVLVLHGDRDACQPRSRSERVAELTGGVLVPMEGVGHIPNGREPVKVDLLMGDFIRRAAGTVRPPPRWTRGLARPKRALYLSSPIGLGHARRDLAIADELRALVPDLQVDWLTQHPVTRFLEGRGERIHPASDALANESAHIESQAAEHDVHVFQALRDMDEILVANFLVFHDLLEGEPYDLVIGDEAWDVDHFLHENPELKRTSFVWMTDFVGMMPLPDGGQREAFLTADYNAEMIEHVERFPGIRDRSVFVGNPEDIVPGAFGPGLPEIRAWTEARYAFAGYVTGFDPAALPDREEVRAELGYHSDEKVCVVTVGGSGVGDALLRRVVEAFPAAQRRVPELRMVVVAGPRIDTSRLPAVEGPEILGYVNDLYRLFVASDLAIAHGGLSTCMELTAVRRPFLYFPIRHHFEENIHVRHRLERYGAGRRMDYATADVDAIAEAIAEEIGRDVDYLPVETDGAARAATLIAELV
jgi:pimeloyl-ACP methyl ester carboxylesterase/predicted glycosyltransferase